MPHGGAIATPGLKPSAAAVLELLRERPAGITAIDALAAVGSFRLGARIWELKAAGYEITSETIRTGSGKHISRYRLIESDQLRMALA